MKVRILILVFLVLLIQACSYLKTLKYFRNNLTREIQVAPLKGYIDSIGKNYDFIYYIEYKGKFSNMVFCIRDTILEKKFIKHRRGKYQTSKTIISRIDSNAINNLDKACLVRSPNLAERGTKFINLISRRKGHENSDTINFALSYCSYKQNLSCNICILTNLYYFEGLEL